MNLSNLTFRSLHLTALTMAVVLVGLCMPRLGAQEDLLDEELEFLISALQKQVGDLQSELAESRKGTNKPLEESLAAANQEAEDYRVRYRDLVLRVEALGIDTIRSEQALQERLATAVRERQLYKERHEKALRQLAKLNDAVTQFLPTARSQDAALQAALKAEMRQAELILAGAETNKPVRKVKLTDGRVISYKDELGLAVLNIGSLSGVMVGMPVNIFRKDRVVGTALVVEVRDTISGAIVQEIYGEGDRVRVQDEVKPRTTSAETL